MVNGRKIYRLYWFLPFILLGCLVYSNTIHVPFYFDDVPNIVENPAIRLTDFSLAGLVKAGTESPLANRPFAYMTFAMNYFFHQYELAGYHLVNIAIHILTALFLFRLFYLTLTATCFRNNIRYPQWLAFFAALLWMVHPLQTQSVTYIVQRMNSLAALFFVLAMLMYVMGRTIPKYNLRIASFAGCALSWLLAIASKEIAATLPFFLLLYEWYFFQDLNWEWLKQQRFYIAGLAIILLLLVLFFLDGNPMRYILEGYHYRFFDLPQRVMTQFRVVFIYIKLFLLPWPAGLSLEHDIILSRSLLDPPTTLLSLLALLGIAVTAVISARKHRLLSFALLWFLGNLVIESSVIPLELIFEHRMYLPSMFFCLVLSDILFRYGAEKLAMGILIFIIGISSVWAYERNEIWKEPIFFHKSIVENAPGNWRAQYNYGLLLYQAEKYDEAIQHLKKTIELQPHQLQAYSELGLAYTVKGAFEDAFVYLNKAREFAPGAPHVYVNLGYLYSMMKDNNKAMMYYEKAAELDPENVDTLLRAGYLNVRMGRYQEAIRHLQKVLAISPAHRLEMLNNIGTYYFRIGNYDKALLYFMEALALAPENRLIQSNIEIARRKKMEQVIN